MARTLVRLSGKSEDTAQIQFTGLREGEKLQEELFYCHEKVLPTSCDKIKRVNGSKPDWSWLCSQLDELHASMNIDGAGPIRAKIKEIVPEYTYLREPTAEITLERYSEHRFRSATAHD